jgi:hypothetical protein
MTSISDLFQECAKLRIRASDCEFDEFFDAGFACRGLGYDPVSDIVAFVFTDMALAGGHI